jgi:hypothetical protein
MESLLYMPVFIKEVEVGNARESLPFEVKSDRLVLAS